VPVEAQRRKFLFDLVDTDRSGRRCGDGGRNAADRRLNEIAPAVPARRIARRSDPAVGLLNKEVRIAGEQGGLPGAICLVCGHHELHATTPMDANITGTLVNRQ
jgi:hypothetical protein